MSCQDAWVDKGSTHGTSQNYTDQIFLCNLDDSTTSELIPSLPETVTEAQPQFFEDLEKVINSEFQADDKVQFKNLLKHHMVYFASNSKIVGRCTVTEHTIQPKEGTKPINGDPTQASGKHKDNYANTSK